MSKYPSHVLVALDPEGDDDAVLDTAIRIARDHSAQTSALTVLPPPLYIQHGLATVEIEFEKDLEAAVSAGLESKCAKHGLDDKRAHVIRGQPGQEIGRFASRHHMDVVCVGLHDRHGGEYFLGTTATGVLRHADADVYGCRTELRDGYYRKVVIGVDLENDAASETLLRKARQFLAPYPDARIYVTSVLPPFSPGTAMSAETPTLDIQWTTLTNQWRAASEARLTQLSDQLTDASCKILEGVPSRALKEAVDELSADLLIMGTGEHVGIGWHIGSTTNNVMHGVSCDVLAIRPR